MPNKWLFATALLCALGGVVAFIAYWLTKDHHASIKILSVFTSLALLLLIFSGGKVESKRKP
jgi:VIT1/CCC1 family predicted Fe2+/Mn2+ transporter